MLQSGRDISTKCPPLSRGRATGASLFARLFASVAAAALLSSCATAPQTVCRATVPGTDHIDVHGNVYLDNYPSGLLHRAFEAGDTAIVTIAGRKYRLKVVTDIHDAAPGTSVLHFRDGSPAYDRFAVINGAFADMAGMAKSVPAENGGKPSWAPADGVEFPIPVEIAKRERQAKRPRFEHYAKRSDERADYPGLTDAEFANFRPVSAPSIASGTLYRSSSPIDPSLGRSRYADASLAACGVKTVWNMADTPDDIIRRMGADYGYSRCRVMAKPLGTDFNSPFFKSGILGGLLFLSENEPPFLIHCREGRDRTGFVAMLLEALCGASRAEIKADYVKSYENFARGKFDRGRVDEAFAYGMKALGLDDAADADLPARAREYLRGIGMEDHEIKALLDRLSGKVR